MRIQNAAIQSGGIILTESHILHSAAPPATLLELLPVCILGLQVLLKDGFPFGLLLAVVVNRSLSTIDLIGRVPIVLEYVPWRSRNIRIVLLPRL